MIPLLAELNPIEWLALLLMMGALALAAWRLLLGPGSADRVVAADTLSILVTNVIISVAALFTSALYLDVALLYVTLAFIGVVALARAIDQQRDARSESDKVEEEAS